MDIGRASSAVTSGAQSSIVEEKSLADPGEGLGPPYFWTKLRPEGAKKFFGNPPSLISGSVGPDPPPPRSEGLDLPLQYASYRCLFLKWIHHREGGHLECRPLEGVPLKFEKYWQLSALLCYASA